MSLSVTDYDFPLITVPAISGELEEYLRERGMDHTYGTLYRRNIALFHELVAIALHYFMKGATDEKHFPIYPAKGGIPLCGVLHIH